MQKGKKPDNISPSLSVTISAKLCRENERKDGSGSFRSIAFRFKDSCLTLMNSKTLLRHRSV